MGGGHMISAEIKVVVTTHLPLADFAFGNFLSALFFQDEEGSVQMLGTLLFHNIRGICKIPKFILNSTLYKRRDFWVPSFFCPDLEGPRGE